MRAGSRPGRTSDFELGRWLAGHRRSIALGGVLVLGALACADSPTVPFDRLSRSAEVGSPVFTLSTDTIRMVVGATAPLIASAVDAEGRPADRLDWTSSDPGVAAVSPQGVVTGIAIGTARVTAAALGLTREAVVIVTPTAPDRVGDLAAVAATDVSIRLRWTQVSDGASGPARYGVRYGSPRLTPGVPATEIPVGGTAVGEILEHNVTGLQPGTPYEFQVVTYRDEPGGPVTGPGSDLVLGQTAALPEVTVAPVAGDGQSGVVGETLPIALELQVTAAGQPRDGATIGWSTDDGAVSSPSTTTAADGRTRVTWTLGPRSGPQTVTATLHGIGRVTFAATAVPGPVATVTLSPSSASLASGGTLRFVATPRDALGNVVEGALIAWSSADGSVASVDPAGVATARAVGSTSIVATAGGQSAAAPLSVQPTAPLAVTDLRVVRATPTSLTLRWTEQADGAGGAAAYLLRVRRGTGGPQVAEAAVPGARVGGSLEHTVEDLQPGVEYEAQLVSYRGTAGAGGTPGGASNRVTGRTPPDQTMVLALSTTAGDGQTGTVGDPLPTRLEVSVTEGGAPKAGVVIAWSVTEGAGELSSASTSTGTDGRAVVIWTLGTTAGAQAVRAEAAGVGAVSFTATARPGPIGRVVVAPSTATVALGSTRAFSARAEDAHGNPVSEASFSWASADASTAMVDASGVATGRAAGTVVIRASAGGRTGSATLTVNAIAPSTVTDLRVIGATPTSLTVRWTQVADGAGGPASYALRRGSPTVSWNSAAPTEVTVAGTAVGSSREHTFTGLTSGTSFGIQLVPYRGTLGAGAVLGALSNVAVGRTSTAAPLVAALVVTPASQGFTAVGSTVQLTVEARDQHGAIVPGTAYNTVSTNTSVATVDAMGRVTARGIGSAAIVVTAVCCAASDTAQVTVTPVPATIAVTPPSVSVGVGGSEALTAVVRDTNGNRISTAQVSWSSRNTGIATVTQGGLVRGVAAGTTVVEAASGSVRQEVPVAVTASSELDSISDLRVSSVTPTSITLRWTEVSDGNGVPADYLIVYDIPPVREQSPKVPVAGRSIGSTASHTITGVSPGTGYQIVVVPYRETGAGGIPGKLSNMVTAVTDDAPGGASPLFTESFESGGLQQAGSGVRWGESVRASVTGDNPFAGSRSLEFNYGPDAPGEDSFSEQRFSFPATNQIWIEYQLYVPPNYRHRPDQPNNNKFFRLFTDPDDGTFSLTLETVASGNQRVSGTDRFKSESGGAGGIPFETEGTANVIGPTSAYPIQIGEWTRIRIHFKGASGRNVKDGRVRVWANGTLFKQLAWDFWPTGGSGPVRIDRGYLMGWANSGFSERTTFHIDDFKLWTSNPGW